MGSSFGRECLANAQEEPPAYQPVAPGVLRKVRIAAAAGLSVTQDMADRGGKIASPPHSWPRGVFFAAAHVRGRPDAYRGWLSAT